MKAIVLSLVVSVSILLSCSSRKYVTHQELIEYISNGSLYFGGNLYMMSEYSGYLFCPSNGDTLKIFESSNLYKTTRTVYNEDSLTFKEYALGVLSGKIAISCEEVESCFVLDDSVTADYNSMPLDSFIRKYSRTFFNKDKFSLKQELRKNAAAYSVMYYLFINDYYAYYEYIAGVYFCERLKALPKMETEEIFLKEDEDIFK